MAVALTRDLSRFSLDVCKYLCLDEADRMIGEPAFEEEVRRPILTTCKLAACDVTTTACYLLLAVERNYPLLATYYLLRTTHHSSPATHHPRLTTRYSPPATYHPLLTTRYLPGA